jgi:hypothetical protein
MKLHYEGEKGKALCERDGLSNMTYAYRDVPFSDGTGIAKGILVGVCDRCGEVVAIPPQSTPAIKAARDGATISVEALLPAIYLEILNLASYRIDPSISLVKKDVHKHLITYYLHLLTRSEARAKRLGKLSIEKSTIPAQALLDQRQKKRLSMKVSRATGDQIRILKQKTNVSTTELLKSVIAEIDRDIVQPEKPAHLKDLRLVLSVANG